MVDIGQELNDEEGWEELGDMQDKHWITIDRQLIRTQTQTQTQRARRYVRQTLDSITIDDRQTVDRNTNTKTNKKCKQKHKHKQELRGDMQDKHW